jgi:hypothetical protein
MTTKRFDALCATTICAATLCGTTLSATNFSGVSFYGTTLSATNISGTSLTAGSVGGTEATSACELFPVLSVRAGKVLCAGYGAPGKAASTCFTGDGYLSATIGGNNWYIIACSSVSWQT